MPTTDRSPDSSRVELRAIVAQHRPMVAAVCGRYLTRAADVDDAVQETFLRLLRHGAGQPIDSLPAWLTRVAQTVCLDALRRKGSDRRRVEGATIVLPGERREPGAMRRHAAIELRLTVAMRQLSESDQQLIAERFVADVPLRAIAVRTGQSIATVSRRVARAIGQLAGILREMGVDGSDEHLLAEHFADPAYAAARDLSEPDSPLRVARDRRALEASLRGQAFSWAGDTPPMVGPLMPGWTRPIRVGALVSHASNLQIGHRGTRTSGDSQVQSTGLLVDPRFELVAVVEPRTTHLGPIERTIRDYGLLAGLIEADDAAGLASLDVLLFGINFRVSPTIVEAIRSAVRNAGVGLLKESWLGSQHVPQLPAEASDLMLAGSPMVAYHMPGNCGRAVDAVVCATSPLIGDVPVGTRFRASGCAAVYAPAPGATMLIRRVPTHAAESHGIPGHGTLPSPVMLAGEIGRGRAVVFNDTTHTLQARRGAFGADYFPRLIAWLAGPRRAGPPPGA